MEWVNLTQITIISTTVGKNILAEMGVAQETEFFLSQLSVKAYTTFLRGQDTRNSHPSFLHFA